MKIPLSESSWKFNSVAVEFILGTVILLATTCSTLFTTRLNLPSEVGPCGALNRRLPDSTSHNKGPNVVTQVSEILTPLAQMILFPDGTNVTTKEITSY